MNFPDVVAGGTLSFALRFLEYYGTYSEKDQDIAALRVGLGPVDARPVSGQYRLKLGTAAKEIGVNTTAFLSALSGAAEIADALNALTGKDSTFSCMDIPGAVLIRRADGQPQVLSVVSNRMIPVSFGRVTGIETDGEWAYELRLTIAPMAFADTATRVLPDQPSITTIQEGGSENGYEWNEIQQLYVPPNFKGIYQIRYGEFAKTTLLDLQDGPTQLQEAINAMLKLPDGTVLGTVTVTNPVQDYAHIEFGGDLKGTNVPQMDVVVFSAPEGDWTFDLPLDRAELFFALRESATLTLPFEAEADFYIDPANHSAGTVTRKLWQTTMRVKRPQIMPDMATVPGIDWLRANPVDYVPFTENQIVTGPQIYSAVIGNGDTTNFSIAHGMDTSAIANIVVRENTASWRALTEGVDFNATITNANEVQLAFGTAPATNGLLVYVQSAPEARQWDAHTHTQEQIEGLTILLESMLQRITVLESLLPRAGAAGMAGGSPIAFELPEVGEVLPDVNTLDSALNLASQIIVKDNKKQDFPSGTDVAAQIVKDKEEEAAIKKDPEALPANVLYRVMIPGIGKTGQRGTSAEMNSDGTVKVPAVPEEPSDPAVWPMRSATMAKAERWPLLLPAQESENPISFGTANSLPTMTEATVWNCTVADGLVLPGSGGRRSQFVKYGEKFASDGRCFYRVVSGGSSLWHPAEMDRELWRVLLADEQFPEGATLSIGGEIRMRMLGDFFDDDARGIGRVDLGAQYLLRCEAVPVQGTLTLDAASSPVVLGETRVTLSPALETFKWSLSIRREAAGMVSSWMAYRKAKEGQNFELPAALRMRLTGFDIDDDSPDPRGQVALIMPATRLEITL